MTTTEDRSCSEQNHGATATMDSFTWSSGSFSPLLSRQGSSGAYDQVLRDIQLGAARSSYSIVWPAQPQGPPTQSSVITPAMRGSSPASTSATPMPARYPLCRKRGPVPRAPGGATRAIINIFVNPFERGEIGPDLFRAACRMGLEDLVSKRRDRPYQAGRSKHWVKVKNRQHPAMDRVMEAFG
jgi:hypothetical protein